MFKKKAVGTVTIVEDVPDDDVLGLQQSRHARGPGDDLSQMTAHELEALALASANSGQESTTRALAMAVETREIGVNTAHALQMQTEQLDRLGNEIVEVHDVLDRSDVVIDKMSRGKLSRMLRRARPVGKGLDKVRASKKEMAEREALKARGLRAVDLDSMGGSSSRGGIDEVVGDEEDDDSVVGEDREELFEVKGVQKKGRLGHNGKAAPGPRSARDAKEDYSQYSSGVATAMRKQDDDLDAISDVLKDMRMLAGGMGDELKYQEHKIAEVTTFTNETSNRTKGQAERVKRI
jgi:hypothetical protein